MSLRRRVKLSLERMIFELAPSLLFAMYPSLKASSLREMMTHMMFYPGRSEIPWIIYTLTVSLICCSRSLAARWITGTASPILGVYPEKLGEVFIRSSISEGLGLLTAIIIRWSIVIHYYTSGRDVPYHKLIEQLPLKEGKLFLTLAKVNFVLATLSTNTLLIMGEVHQLLRSTSKIEVISHISWIAIDVECARIVGVDLAVAYIVAFAAFYQVHTDCVDLRRSIDCPSVEDNYPATLRQKYMKLMTSLSQFRRLGSLIKMAGEMALIPTLSSIFYTFLSVDVTMLEKVKKHLILAAGVYFTSNAYFVAFVWASIEKLSMKMHERLNSSLCSGRRSMETQSSYDKRRNIELRIMEDIASSRNHIAVSNYDDTKVTTLDILTNFLLTFQICLLFIDFSPVFSA